MSANGTMIDGGEAPQWPELAVLRAHVAALQLDP